MFYFGGIILLIGLLILLIIAVKKKDSKLWWSYFSLLGGVLISFLIQLAVVFTFVDGWDGVAFFLFDIFAFIVLGVFILISGITKFVEYLIRKNKGMLLDKIDKKAKLEVVFTRVISVVMIMLFFVGIDVYPYTNFAKSKNAVKAEKVVLEYLDDEYGNGDFEVVSWVFDDICSADDWAFCSRDGYVFTIKTSYFDEEFTLEISEKNFEIEDDRFLNTYFGIDIEDNFYFSNLVYYISREKSELFSSKFDAYLSFDREEVYREFENMDFEDWPPKEEILNTIRLYNPTITLTKKINDKESLINYIVEMSTYYFLEFDKQYIHYDSDIVFYSLRYNFSNVEGFENSNLKIGHVYLQDDNHISIKIGNEEIIKELKLSNV